MTSGLGSPGQRRSPKSVPTAPSWPWERGLAGADPALWKWGRALPGLGEELLFARCSLGWKKQEARGEPGQTPQAAGPWAACSAPLASGAGAAAAAFWGK